MKIHEEMLIKLNRMYHKEREKCCILKPFSLYLNVGGFKLFLKTSLGPKIYGIAFTVQSQKHKIIHLIFFYVTE